ncbi:hypothetical protein GCM10023340_31900 [Nocardioides marinquilinus]|uniref:Uncharacterized protein n=1 Tax=Nocardioides marinquilinus TaxID=1210400 RepID=A0ABP9PWC1_9ACTN
MPHRLLRQPGAALLALGLAVGGGASYAAAQLPKDSVKAFQIAPNAVGASELATGAVSGVDVRDGSIGLADLSPGARPGPAVQQFGTTGYGATCSDDDENGEVCASLQIKLKALSTLTIQARSGWGTAAFDDTIGPGAGSDSTAATGGYCQIVVDGNVIPSTDVHVGESRAAAGGPRVLYSADGYYTGTLTTSAFVVDSAAATHTVQLRCTEVDGDVDWTRAAITVVAVPST